MKIMREIPGLDHSFHDDESGCIEYILYIQNMFDDSGTLATDSMQFMFTTPNIDVITEWLVCTGVHFHVQFLFCTITFSC